LDNKRYQDANYNDQHNYAHRDQNPPKNGFPFHLAIREV